MAKCKRRGYTNQFKAEAVRGRALPDPRDSPLKWLQTRAIGVAPALAYAGEGLG